MSAWFPTLSIVLMPMKPCVRACITIEVTQLAEFDSRPSGPRGMSGRPQALQPRRALNMPLVFGPIRRTP